MLINFSLTWLDGCLLCFNYNILRKTLNFEQQPQQENECNTRTYIHSCWAKLFIECDLC